MLRSVSVLGVDGRPGGWIGAEVSGRTVRWHVAGTAAELLELPVDAVGIDIPIGLPAAGTRACDRAARDELGPARSSVFWAPPRTALGAATHAEAVARCHAAGAPGLSIQAWRIVPKVTEVDRWMTPDRQRRVVEVHPEVSFRRLDGRVAASKKTARGAGERLRALAGWVELGDLAGLPAVALDDALDAVVAAWSAARHLAGTAVALGDGGTDARGLRMEIVT